MIRPQPGELGSLETNVDTMLVFDTLTSHRDLQFVMDTTANLDTILQIF